MFILVYLLLFIGDNCLSKHFKYTYLRFQPISAMDAWGACFLLSHICWRCIFCFLPFYISMWCVFMSVIILARDGNPLRTGAVGPFLVLCLVLVLRYMYVWFVVRAREGCAAFHVVCMLFVTNYVWKWIMDMEIDFVCLTSNSLTTIPFDIPYTRVRGSPSHGLSVIG